MDGLIGYTGFVGSNLCSQRKYDIQVNSKNFLTLKGKEFDRIVCAGVSAVKWKANKNPEEDLQNINRLAEVLKTVKAKKFILISTIDVYSVNTGVDEDFDCSDPQHHPYGRNRLYFENFCKAHFPSTLIVRLPGLFGTGIKKNVIFDLMNDNCLDMINPDSTFQYYYLKNLSDDIELAEKNNIQLINLFTEPISTREIIDLFFPGKQTGANPMPKGSYNMYTKYAALRNKSGHYLYTADEVKAQLREFITEEMFRK